MVLLYLIFRIITYWMALFNYKDLHFHLRNMNAWMTIVSCFKIIIFGGQGWHRIPLTRYRYFRFSKITILSSLQWNHHYSFFLFLPTCLSFPICIIVHHCLSEFFPRWNAKCSLGTLAGNRSLNFEKDVLWILRCLTGVNVCLCAGGVGGYLQCWSGVLINLHMSCGSAWEQSCLTLFINTGLVA